MAIGEEAPIAVAAVTIVVAAVATIAEVTTKAEATVMARTEVAVARTGVVAITVTITVAHREVEVATGIRSAIECRKKLRKFWFILTLYRV